MGNDDTVGECVGDTLGTGVGVVGGDQTVGLKVGGVGAHVSTGMHAHVSVLLGITMYCPPSQSVP